MLPAILFPIRRLFCFFDSGEHRFQVCDLPSFADKCAFSIHLAMTSSGDKCCREPLQAGAAPPRHPN
jgi:hypothetical protein